MYSQCKYQTESIHSKKYLNNKNMHAYKTHEEKHFNIRQLYFSVEGWTKTMGPCFSRIWFEYHSQDPQK